MKAIRFTARSVPVALALMTILAYGLLLPLTGFYWDDWPFAWIAHFLGSAEFIPAFTGFRPFLGPVFFFTTSLLPANPLLWQVAALVVRFLAALAARFAIGQIRPTAPRLGLAATLLFLIYPGYSQHWVAFTHINQEWISLIAYLLSFGLGVRAIRDPRTRPASIAGALLLQVVALLPTEYFIGLELLRPVLLWSVLSESITPRGSRLRATLRLWFPYLLIWLLNAMWLGYYYWSGAYISYGLHSGASSTGLLDVLRAMGEVVWKAGFYAWFQILPLAAATALSPTGLATVAIGIVAFGLLTYYLLHLHASNLRSPSPRDNEATGNSDRDVPAGRFFVLLGIVGILLGRVPSFAAGLPLTLQSSFDRLMISMLPGASLFLAGLLELLVPRARWRTYALAALVALGVGQQFFNANIFRRDWQRQQEIYWQLAWRIPALKPNTAILTQQMPLDYETDLAMTAAVNWMYAASIARPELPYAVVYTEKRLGGDVLPNLRPGTPMRLPFRTMEFTGSTSEAISIYVPANGCLRVFDPAHDDAETYSRFPESITAPIPLSDPSRIETSAPPRSLPAPPFVPEPTHGWCYFYERAELHWQAEDWTALIALRAEFPDEWRKASDPFEWLPFIEAEARAGDTSWAAQATREATTIEPRLQRGLCALWKRVERTGTENSRFWGKEIRGEIGCTP